jgi:hypothetical protein
LRKNSDCPQRHCQTLLLRELSPMKGAAMRELSCSKKRYMTISPWGLPRLDHPEDNNAPPFNIGFE